MSCFDHFIIKRRRLFLIARPALLQLVSSYIVYLVIQTIGVLFEVLLVIHIQVDSIDWPQRPDYQFRYLAKPAVYATLHSESAQSAINTRISRSKKTFCDDERRRIQRGARAGAQDSPFRGAYSSQWYFRCLSSEYMLTIAGGCGQSYEVIIVPIIRRSVSL